MMPDDTRKALIRRLRRLLARLERDAPQRSRVCTPHWRREARTIVHPEADLSEWVHRRMITDWDAVKEGKNRG